ncbi:MAG: class 1 fructose-bisphosphatase [Bacteroidetes bacterium]|nr:class 1 fructose-bisphosphatase [Bacteroidota bacterium]
MTEDRKILTLQQFISSEEKLHPEATGEFSQLMRDISLAARIVSREVNRAGLSFILGEANLINVQGESVQKLDVYAENAFLSALRLGGMVGVYGSEEQDDVVPLAECDQRHGKYAVLIDPLDGSSNIDVNVSIGTIFSIYKRISVQGAGNLEDCLQPGLQQVAAGYVLYGSSTMLVYTTGNGVNGFTLEPSLGEFILSHPGLKLPAKPRFYSINQAVMADVSEGLKDYIVDVEARNASVDKPLLNARYIGSLVADFHRNLLQGGIFIYPGTQKKPQGKLRLMYEANPMAFLIEQAGGMATDGRRRIMDIAPEALHQRTPLFIGNSSEVERVMSFIVKNG